MSDTPSRGIAPKLDDERLGIPPAKFGAFFLPLQQDKRQAVMMLLFPPVELRDAPYEVIEKVVLASGQSMLRTIAREIHQAYTSEPPTVANLQNVMTALQGQLDASTKPAKESRKGS